MQRNTQTGNSVMYLKVLLGLFLFSSILAAQQIPKCVPAAGSMNLRSEGLAESATDITLSCTGFAAGVSVTATVSIFTSVNITNHLSTNNTPDIVVSVTAGGFQQSPATNIQLVGNNDINISGIQFTPGTDGGATIKISNLRVNANSAAGNTPALLTANLAATGFSLTGTQVQLGAVTSGLLSSDLAAEFAGSGAALPATLTMPNLFTAGTPFITSRVTEGFVNAFIPKDATSDYGTRIMLQYSGLPPSTQLAVPDLIAGSSALQPTAGGNLGTPQSPGTYASSANGSLLLARVNNPNTDGSGGAPFFVRPAGGTAQMTLSTATLLTINNGSAFVVYEVVDANPAVQESAQIPTFITISGGPGNYGALSLSFAPVSTVGIATTATPQPPVPRFAAVTPPGDCTVVGDCTAGYFPQLKLNASSVTLQSSAGGTPAVGYLPFVNTAPNTVMSWTATVSYQTGSGWLSINPASGATGLGSNGATVNVHADPTNLSAGVYNATITIDAGPGAGSQSVPVIFTVGLALPLITQVANAANGYVTSLVPGSFASVYGTSLTGNVVTVSFDGVGATTTYNSATQINLLVPGALTGKTSAQMLVSVDGRNSAPAMVSLLNAAPAIFTNGILNQDNSVNSASNPAVRGSSLQIFLTGLPPVAGSTVNVGSQSLQSVYSGQAPGVPGLQQVNVLLPANLTGTAQLTVCAAGAVCTPAYSVTIQ